MSGADKGGANGHAENRTRTRMDSETVGHGSSPTSEEQKAEAPREASTAQVPELVLIVEDEAPLAEALSLIVADAGYSPLLAQHGLEALEIARPKTCARLHGPDDATPGWRRADCRAAR